MHIDVCIDDIAKYNNKSSQFSFGEYEYREDEDIFSDCGEEAATEDGMDNNITRSQ